MLTNGNIYTGKKINFDYIIFYSGIPLKLGLNQCTDYAGPHNAVPLGGNYLFFGFLPYVKAQNNNVQGLQVNSVAVSFINSDKNPNSHITLFPNFKELTPTTYSYSVNWPFCNQLFDATVANPSCRVIPDDFFMFTERHWGGGGCYSQTDGRLVQNGILSTTIGFR